MNLKFNKDGLIPAVVQDYESKKVLMLAYMNKESFDITMEEKRTCFYSRSRQELWRKGETSGNVQKVKKISIDCDSDTILLEVEQEGNACHTGEYSCFHNYLLGEEEIRGNVIRDIFKVVKERKANPVEGSYTTYLFNEGVDKILKKVGEETAEVIIASKNNNDELIYEISDLIYHLIVLMEERGLAYEDILKELGGRRK
ncbi:MAG: bifunctional phosphoribosyl-AMP cyclohydrolase/phosphoribosyl-ATP diphosphatase HisIE [Firmicutes bacterium]|jgi:phosphoribosyl-ATP pyrophosphohydrolase/phosphoribosyl-AMP cyclohydrolase|nr:bifunctional phosphoribosyl-AMP cyclohydrolase/phosphoribosyl-ATP diphosphatase HisIE [Bacillota bacterium]